MALTLTIRHVINFILNSHLYQKMHNSLISSLKKSPFGFIVSLCSSLSITFIFPKGIKLKSFPYKIRAFLFSLSLVI